MNSTRPGAGLLQILIISLLAACSSGPSKPSKSAALTDLEAGRCPDSIVYSEGQTPDSNRYGSDTKFSDLSHYRDRELDNCRQQLAQGDSGAMHTLASYWQDQKDPVQQVNTYRLYLESGSDPEQLQAAARALFQLFDAGQPGLSPDAEAAIYYLGQAVGYGDSSLRLLYADRLYARGQYEEALGHYFEFQLQGLQAAEAQGSTRLEYCEANLRLADMYFSGRGTAEDEHLGYFFWQRGLDHADGREWGSCYRDNFVYGDRYYSEEQRKKSAEQKMAWILPGDVRELDRALDLPLEQGLAIAGSFSGLSTLPNSSRVTGGERLPTVRYSTTGFRGWHGWSPLEGDICGVQLPGNALQWADVFELRSTAVWNLKSVGQGGTTRGSAVAVAPDRLVTNCHLIHDPDRVDLFQGSLQLQAQVSASDVEGDRCVLAVDQAMPSYVRASRPFGYLRVGEEVAAIGNPRGLDTSLSRGIIAQKRTNTGLSLIQTDAALSTGSSGGGLFDQAGNLVGVTTFKVDEGENLNFAIAIDEFCR